VNCWQLAVAVARYFGGGRECAGDVIVGTYCVHRPISRTRDLNKTVSDLKDKDTN
jgi:hypothetical protein